MHYGLLRNRGQVLWCMVLALQANGTLAPNGEAMWAMAYEYIIRRAFQVGRGEQRGQADADVYRRYEHAVHKLRLAREAHMSGGWAPTSRPIDDLEYEVRKEAAGVCVNLNGALAELKKRFPERMEELDRLTLDPYRSYYETSTLEKSMDMIAALQRELGLVHR